MPPLERVDPAWAWSPFEPDKRQPWNRRLAAHLYRRAGFAADWRTLNRAATSGPREVVQQLLTDNEATRRFDQEMESLARTVLGTSDPESLSAWWLYRMIHTPQPLKEKTVLFWHGHFATSAAKVENARLMYKQHQLLRKHAWGDFEKMVQGISRDPAMLIWLDSTTNRKSHPNENYARELMELFCLGVGNYTEKDIQEIARTFTGWEVRREEFHFSPHRHDDGEKQFLGRRGEFGGDDAVKIVLEQPAAARFIARKLVRYFVCDEPELPNNLIDPVAARLRENGFRIEPAVEMILTSQLFYSKHAFGRKVRSPVELAVGLLRALEGTANTHELAKATRDLGQGVFFPPNVKGWDGGRTWINSSTLLGRANLVRAMTHSQEASYAGGEGLAAVVARHGIDTPEELVDWLHELLVAVPVPEQARRELIDFARTQTLDSNEGVGEVIHAVSLLPEFQLA